MPANSLPSLSNSADHAIIEMQANDNTNQYEPRTSTPVVVKRRYVRKLKTPNCLLQLLTLNRLLLLMIVTFFNTMPDPAFGGHCARNVSLDMLQQLGRTKHATGLIKRQVSLKPPAMDPIKNQELDVLKSFVTALFEGTHYGHHQDEESIKSYLGRMTFNYRKYLLCLPVREKKE